MQAHILVDANRAGVAVDFNTAEIEDEAVHGRAVDLVGGIGRSEHRRAPEHGLPQCRLGRTAGRPMIGCRDAGKAERILGVRRREDAPTGEEEILRPRVQLRRGDAGQPVSEPGRCNMHGGGGRTGEPA